MEFAVKGKLVDIFKEEIYPAEINIKEGKISTIKRIEEGEFESTENYILPGFVDSHIHI